MKLVYDEMLSRFMTATGSQSQAELARRLGIQASSITNWKKTGTVPLMSVVKHLPKEAAIWVIYGEDKQEGHHDDQQEHTEEPSTADPDADIEAVRRQVSRLEGRLEQCQAINTQLLQAITELSRLGGAPVRETTVH